MTTETIPLRSAGARLDTRGRAFSRALELWLTKAGRYWSARAIREHRAEIARAVRKQQDPAEAKLREDLLALVRRFGLRQAADAANRTAATLGRDGGAAGQLLSESLVRDAIAGKPVKIKWFEEWNGAATARALEMTEHMKASVRESVRRILAEAEREVPTPSAGEIARRIRTQFHGPEEGGRIPAFSSERAAVIARTELVQAENTGIVAGYEASGVKRIRWLAYRDGRSGDRHHERMHGVEIDLGERFTLPSGARLRYPGDPLGPIGETAQCRCTTRAVIAEAR